MKAHDKALRDLVSGDGCTSAPELWFHSACMIHDQDYETKIDEDGNSITRKQADERFLQNMKKASPNALVRITLPYLYYAAVRIFGGSYWDN